MLKVLLITSSHDYTGQSNVGDRVILAGVRNLLAGAFGPYAYQETGRWAEFPRPADDYDLVVYAGMPQYGARHAPTVVEQRFQNYIDSAQRAQFINIGGGSPAGIDVDIEGAAGRMATSGIGQFYRDQKKIALRTTRDALGKLFFDKIETPAELRPCPSFFCSLHVKPAEKVRNSIAFLSDDTFVTNRIRGDMGEHLSRLIERLPGYDLCAHSKGDLVQLGRKGLQHLYFRSELDAIDYYSTVGRLASLRIHAGVPAWTLGADVVVGAFDGRARMFADVGMPLPVLDMVVNDFTALADAVENPATHTPHAERMRLIEGAYVDFATRLRQALPDKVGTGEPITEPPEGFSVYPLEGRIERREGSDVYWPPKLERQPQFVPETPAGVRGVVVIPDGAVAAQGAYKETVLPLKHRGSEFKGTSGQPEGDVLVVPLGKRGALARAPQLRLPFGRYRAKVVAEVEADAAIRGTVQLVLLGKTAHSPYGEVTQTLSALPAGKTPVQLVLEFENTFPSAALILDLILRGDAAPKARLRIQELKVESAG